MEENREQKMMPYVGDYCPYLEEESSEDYEVMTVNAPFRPKCVINI